MSDKINIKLGCKSTYIPLFEIMEKGGRDKIRKELRSSFKELNMNDCGGISSSSDEQGWWNNPDNITLTKNRWPNASKKNLYAIKIEVKKIAYPHVEVNIYLYEYKLEDGRPIILLKLERPFSFTVSYFDMPYMDNTRLFEGERFAIVLKAICSEAHLIREEEDCSALVLQKTHEQRNDELEGEIGIVKEKIALIETKMKREDISVTAKSALQKEKLELEDVVKDMEMLHNATCGDTNDNSVPFAVFQVVTFREEFMSMRDRPLFEEMIDKLQASK